MAELFEDLLGHPVGVGKVANVRRRQDRSPAELLDLRLQLLRRSRIG